MIYQFKKGGRRKILDVNRETETLLINNGKLVDLPPTIKVVKL